ncbi:MAG: AI-2E family transporter [Firmicutes bacterium]|nr:AI-2E family transporter [Alicyclobacillaceae bacterium]MCL6496332.1 AI-2E family transporter [Bacillota bacterium]
MDWATRVRLVRDVVLILLGAGVIVGAVIWALSRVGNVVWILSLALVFEIVLGPAVDRLARYWGRTAATLAVVAGAVLLVVFGGVMLTTLITTQMAALVGRLFQDVNQWSSSTPGLLRWLEAYGVTLSLSDLESRVLNSLGQLSSLLVTQTVNILTHLVNTVVDGALTLFVTVYLLIDAERIHRSIVRLVPQGQREGLLALEHTLGRVVGGYVRGQIALSAVVGLAFGVGARLIGIPFPAVVGVVAAFMELIPLLGPMLGAVLPVAMALLGPNPWAQVPEVLALLGLVHLLESQVLAPRIIRSQVGLHPVLSAVALVVGADLKGVLGALFAVPAAGILVAAWVAGVRVWRERVVLPKEPAGDGATKRTGRLHERRPSSPG